jgi:hypothetical protein
MNHQTLVPITHNAVLACVMDAATDLTEGWDRDFANPIAPESMLVSDLGCQSLDIMVLLGQLSSRLALTELPFEELFMPEGKRVPDFSLGTLSDFLWKQSRSKTNREGAYTFSPEVESPTH